MTDSKNTSGTSQKAPQSGAGQSQARTSPEPAKASQAPRKPVTNPSLIQWPTDKYGICSDLRKAGIALGSRLRGDKQKLETALAQLDLIRQYLIDKCDEGVSAGIVYRRGEKEST